MNTVVRRSIQEPIREVSTWETRWMGPDKGLICCWELGRAAASATPELAARAIAGELPPLGWKGGVERTLVNTRKIGTLFYLAKWQGLRGEDLDIDLSSETTITCAATGMSVTFTADYEKYKN